MLQALSRSYPLPLHRQHLHQQVTSASVQGRILRPLQVKLELLIFLEDTLRVLSIEEVTAHQQNVKDHSHRKNVTAWGQFVSVLAADYLRRKVAWSSTFIRAVVVLPCVYCKSEIADNRLQRVPIPEHNVLQLDIAMQDLLALEFRQSTHHPPHESPDFLQRELRTPSMQIFQQVPSTHHLGDHIVAALRLIDPLKSQQVLVVHSSQDFDLILETVELLWMGTQQLLAENLSSKAFPVLETHHLVHGG